MGNHLACVSLGAQFRGVQVLHADSGFLSELEGTAKVGELMMEYSNQFVCHAKALQSGQRFCPLPADEDLRIGELYILLPMRKLHARVSLEDLAFFSSAMTKSSSKKGSKTSQSKVYAFPLSITDGASNLPDKAGDVSSSLPDKGADVSGIEKRSASEASKSSGIHIFLGPALPGAGVQQLIRCRTKFWIPKLETIAEIAC